MYDDDRVTPEQVAICLDRFATAYRVEREADDVSIYFEAVKGLAADAVVGSVDEYLMTEHWFPVPSRFRDAALARARKLAATPHHGTTDCAFCHGHLWGAVAGVARDGIVYDMSAPCDACAPMLFGRVLDLNRDRKVVEGRTVTRDTSFPFRVGDKIQMCRDVLADVEARAKAAQA